MRSKDIAERAGVTVRTLRHYHQIGLLSEPARDANGYRRYGIQHLVRLLRIGRLSALGLSLSELPGLLDGRDERRSDILNDLDDALAKQIGSLQERRQIVAALRESGGPLDMSPALAGPLLLLERGRSDVANKAGREQSILMTHMVGEKGRPALEDLYERLAAPDLAAITLELGQRFDRLDDETSEAEIKDLAEDYLQNLGPWLDEFNAVLSEFADHDVRMVLWAHTIEATTTPQRRLLAEIDERWTAGKGPMKTQKV